MAKDKSTKTKDAKPAKGEKAPKSKGADESAFAKPSDAPAGDGNRWPVNKGNLGKLMLITPLREQTVANSLGDKGDTKQQIVADVVIFDEKKPAKSVVIEGAEMEGGWILGSLRGYIGERKVLGRLGQDAAKGKGDRAAWVLEDASAADVKFATEYLATVDPFAQGGKTKGKKDK